MTVVDLNDIIGLFMKFMKSLHKKKNRAEEQKQNTVQFRSYCTAPQVPWMLQEI